MRGKSTNSHGSVSDLLAPVLSSSNILGGISRASRNSSTGESVGSDDVGSTDAGERRNSVNSDGTGNGVEIGGTVPAANGANGASGSPSSASSGGTGSRGSFRGLFSRSSARMQATNPTAAGSPTTGTNAQSTSSPDLNAAAALAGDKSSGSVRKKVENTSASSVRKMSPNTFTTNI